MTKPPTLVPLSEEEQKLVREVGWTESTSGWNNRGQVRGEESALKVLVRTDPATVTHEPSFCLVQERILNMKVRSLYFFLIFVLFISFAKMTSGLWPLQSVGQLGHRFCQIHIEILSPTSSIPGDNLASYEQSRHYEGERDPIDREKSIPVEHSPHVLECCFRRWGRKSLSTQWLGCRQRRCHGMCQFLFFQLKDTYFGSGWGALC